MDQQGFTVKVNEMELFYRVHGGGPPLVLLHGFFQSGAQWEPFLAKLGEEYRLVVPDLRGHGRSTNPSNEFTHRQAALDIYALLDKLGISRCRAMGFSTGSMTLLHMATQQPERIEAMVLFSCTPCFPERARKVMRTMTMEDAAPEFLEMLGGLHVRGDLQIRALFNQFGGLAQNYEDMSFTPADLSEITARTLIVHGDRDEFFPVSLAVEMYNAIPAAALWIVPHAGHADLFKAIGIDMMRSRKFPPSVLGFLKADLDGRR